MSLNQYVIIVEHELFPVCDDDKGYAGHFPVVERLLTMRFPELRCVMLRFNEKQRLLGFLAPPHQDVYELRLSVASRECLQL